MTYTISETVLTPELKERIYAEFSKHSIKSKGVDGLTPDPIIFELRNDSGFIGCIGAQLFWGQLHIKHMVIEESYRGKGLGKFLVEQALQFGKNQGCSFAFVETMSFQAPDFYQKLGFHIELERPGYAENTSYYYLKKDL